MGDNWSPMQQVERMPGQKDVWVVFEHAKKIAIIQRVLVGRKQFEIFRAVTYDSRPEQRVLLCYTPALEWCAEIVLKEYYKINPPNSRRR
jgi:hypothetical protein